MSDLIDRQSMMRVYQEVCSHVTCGDCSMYKGDGAVCRLEEWIRRLPAAEPQERKGKWQITDAYPHNVYCSKCHKRFAQTHWAVWEDGSLPRKFCPNCGAWMEGTDGSN